MLKSRNLSTGTYVAHLTKITVKKKIGRSINNRPTPQSTVLLDNLISRSQPRNSQHFMETQKFAIFTSLHWTLFRAKFILTYCLFKIQFNIILSYTPRFLRCSSCQVSRLKFCMHFSCLMRAMCPVHRILFSFIKSCV
jgi:hypothetical protein